MTTLNIGGSGFIGTALTDLLRQGGEQVVSFDIDHSDDADDNGITRITGDVTDYDEVAAAVATHEPDRIANFAYVLGAESDRSPDQAVRVNCVGMDNVFRAACEHDVDRVVYASSIVSYGGPKAYSEAVEEDVESPAAYNQYPLLFYSATKQLNEYQARLYGDRDGHETKFTAIRPGIVFGPGREGGLTQWASDIVTKPVHGRPVDLPFHPDQRLSLVYRDDVAALTTKLLVAEVLDHHAYNTGGHTVTARELADVVEDEFGGTVEFDRDADSLPLVHEVSHQRASDAFDYNLTPLREAMRQHADEVR